MKAIKILLGLLVTVFVFLAIGFFVIYNNVNNIVVDAVEREGSKLVKVPVKLDSADIKILEGSARLLGLQVANPSGYNTPYALNTDEIGVIVDLDAYLKNQKLIKIPE